MKKYARIENISKIEMEVFQETHNSTFDASFIYMNKYLEENYFGDKGLKWNEDKATEELLEVKEASDQLTLELKNGLASQISVHHVIEEIGDWILAASSVLTYDGFDEDKYNKEVKSIKSIIRKLDTKLSLVLGDSIINANSVFQSNKNKIEEYTAALRTYEELQDEDNITFNPLAKLVKMLYTNKQIKDPANKDKIIKEVRRMRFAIMETKKEGIL